MNAQMPVPVYTCNSTIECSNQFAVLQTEGKQEDIIQEENEMQVPTPTKIPFQRPGKPKPMESKVTSATLDTPRRAQETSPKKPVVSDNRQNSDHNNKIPTIVNGNTSTHHNRSNTQRYQKDFLIIGDSNIKGVRIYFHQTSVFNGGNPCIVANGGNRLEDVKNRLNLLIDHKTNLSGCIIHAGTNNVLQKDSSDNILMQTRKCIEIVKDRCADAFIAISSIPPVKYNHEMSQEIELLNQEIEKMCGELDVNFMNYAGHFVKNNQVDTTLFGKRSRIHLNNRGIDIVLDYMFEIIEYVQRKRCYGCNSTRHLIRDCPEKNYRYRCNVCGVASASTEHMCF